MNIMSILHGHFNDFDYEFSEKEEFIYKLAKIRIIYARILAPLVARST